MTNQGADKPLLTLSDVRRWRNQFQHLAEQQAAIEKQMHEISRRLSAAKFFMDDASLAVIAEPALVEVTRRAPASNDRESLPDAIKRIIRDAGKPLAKIDILKELKNDPVHASRFKKSPNYFYTAMGRLEKRHEVIRRVKKYTLPATKNEAPPDKSGGASQVTGEVTPSPLESRDGQHDLLS